MFSVGESFGGTLEVLDGTWVYTQSAFSFTGRPLTLEAGSSFRAS